MILIASEEAKYGGESFLGAIHYDRGVDQQHRAAFYALKDARSSKPAIFIGFLVDASFRSTQGGGPGPCGGRWLGQGKRE